MRVPMIMKDALVNVGYFLGHFLMLHATGMLVKYQLTGSPWDPWTPVWSKVLELFTDDEYLLYVYGTVIVTTVHFWSCAAGYTFLDLTGQPTFLTKYKVQPTKNVPLSTTKLMKVCSHVLFNQIALGIPAGMASYSLWSSRVSLPLSELPSLSTSLLHILVCIISHDIYFYYSHRLLHHRMLYKRIHKIHHEWTAPIAPAALYSHPIEHIFSGIMSASSGIILMGTPMPLTWVWFCLLAMQVMNDHSGYHFPLFFSPEFHDFHHLRFHTSYGWLGIWDWLHGTDKEFVKSKLHEKRHIRLYTTKSARELYPDEPKSS